MSNLLKLLLSSNLKLGFEALFFRSFCLVFNSLFFSYGLSSPAHRHHHANTSDHLSSTTTAPLNPLSHHPPSYYYPTHPHTTTSPTITPLPHPPSHHSPPHQITQQDRLVQLDDAIHVLRTHAEGSQLHNNQQQHPNNNNITAFLAHPTPNMLTSLLENTPNHASTPSFDVATNILNSNNRFNAEHRAVSYLSLLLCYFYFII